MSYPWTTLAKGTSGVLASLLCLESALSLKPVRSMLPLPSPYYNEEILLRRGLLRDFIAKNGEPEIVLLGSSIARSNIDAEVLSRATKRRVFGLGLSAYPPEALTLAWENIWSKEFKSRPLILVVFREYDLMLPASPVQESILMKGRLERGWINPEEISPIEKAGLTERNAAQYYGALSKALSVARGPFFGSPFATGPLGTCPYEVPLTPERRSVLARTVLKIDSDAIKQNRHRFVNAMLSFKRTTRSQVFGVLSPSFVDGWVSPKSRQTTLQETQRELRAVGIPIFTGEQSYLHRDMSSYADFSHFTSRGAKQLSFELSGCLNTIKR